MPLPLPARGGGMRGQRQLYFSGTEKRPQQQYTHSGNSHIHDSHSQQYMQLLTLTVTAQHPPHCVLGQAGQQALACRLGSRCPRHSVLPLQQLHNTFVHFLLSSRWCASYLQPQTQQSSWDHPVGEKGGWQGGSAPQGPAVPTSQLPGGGRWLVPPRVVTAPPRPLPLLPPSTHQLCARLLAAGDVAGPARKLQGVQAFFQVDLRLEAAQSAAACRLARGTAQHSTAHCITAQHSPCLVPHRQ